MENIQTRLFEEFKQCTTETMGEICKQFEEEYFKRLLLENPYCNGDWVEVSESNEPDKSFWFIAQYVKCELKKGVLYHKVRHHILSPLYSCQYIRRYTPVIDRSYNIGQHVKFTIPENGSTPENSSTPENGSCECWGQIAARKPGSYIIKIDEECKNKRRGWVDFYYISDELIF